MRVTVLGYGGLGRAAVVQLRARGDAVTVGHYRKPAGLPKGVGFVRCDVRDAASAIKACDGAEAVIFSVAFPYQSEVWLRDFPPSTRNVVQACAAAGARFIMADNLYMYGPQSRPLVEDMPLTSFGKKPRVRAEITRIWQEAHVAGRIRGASVRASDYYGPDAPNSILGPFGVAPLLKRKPAVLLHDPDQPHDFTYLPDFARAVVDVVHAPDDAYGRAWHVPNAPIRTPRQILKQAADMAGVPLRIMVLPKPMIRLMGLFNKPLGATHEMAFQRDRPYLVDASAFAARFWNDPTPFREGLAETIAWYRAHP
jgi:nucleoside-diphosphate-sugar epimerase